LYAGGKEGAGVLSNVRRFKEAMENRGYDPNRLKIKVATDPAGRHTESKWGEEFPKAIEWLF
jgi:hypothetical protein